MKPCSLILSLILTFPTSLTSKVQTPAQNATAVLQPTQLIQQSIAAMGGTVPGDSSAAGTATITAGSDTQQASITISTRGSSQTLEQFVTATGSKAVVYSKGLANDTEHLVIGKMYSAELAASSQSALFPLPFLSAILSFPDSAYEYLGVESIDGVDCHHVRAWRTFSSQPDFAYLAPFSIRDIWISSTTSLPVKVGYSVRAGRGAEPSTAVEISYSKYQPTGGIQYPFAISKSLNGTPWMAIAISSVSFNTGLSDSSFPVQ